MPITGPASYLPTVAAFLSHWAEVNTALGANPLIIRKETIGAAADVVQVDLDGFADELQGQQVVVQDAVVGEDLARGTLEDVRQAILDAMVMFNAKVRQDLNTTKWQRSVPDLPGVDAGQGRFMAPAYKVMALWGRINADNVLGPATPLVLRDGMTHAQFSTLAGNAEVAFRDHPKAAQAVTTEIEERNDIQDRIYPILKQYRVAVAGMFAPENALMESLPKLTPDQGHTPDAVAAAGVWDAGAAKGRITWDASADGELATYQVRYSAGSEYHEDVEVVVATFEPDAPRECLTLHGLGTPGATARFKVYVVLGTGNERGSNAVEIERPG